jgi:hypothetical protein
MILSAMLGRRQVWIPLLILCYIGFSSTLYLYSYNKVEDIGQTWKHAYTLVERDSYAINARDNRYFVKNSELLYVGNNQNIDDNKWNFTVGATAVKFTDDPDNAVHRVDFTDIEGFAGRSVTTIYAQKLGGIQNGEIAAVMTDAAGNILSTVPASCDRDNPYLLFIPEHSVSGVANIDFTDSDGAYIDIRPDFYIAVEYYDES